LRSSPLTEILSEVGVSKSTGNPPLAPSTGVLELEFDGGSKQDEEGEADEADAEIICLLCNTQDKNKTKIYISKPALHL
jgi:hypothetical protein